VLGWPWAILLVLGIQVMSTSKLARKRSGWGRAFGAVLDGAAIGIVAQVISVAHSGNTNKAFVSKSNSPEIGRIQNKIQIK